MAEINGYELAQIPCSNEGWSNEVSYTELRNDLGEGMETGVLFGANTGNQRFRMSLKLKDYSDSKTIEYNGQMMTPAQYIWDLFNRTKRTNTPFAVRNLRNDQYYLVDFAQPNLSFDRTLHKFYSTGIELKQVRRPGVTVYDPLKLSPLGLYSADLLNLANGQNLAGWANRASGGLYPFVTSNVAYSTPAQNDKGVAVFNGTDSFMSITGIPLIKQAFIVMKANAASWANHGGVLTNSSVAGGADAALVGESGTTKFTNFSHTSAFYAYRKNTISYLEANQQAPMNKYGLVHVRHKTGFSNITNLIVGNDRGQVGRYAAMNVAEIVLFSNHISDTDAFELSEHLKDKWRF